MNATGYLNFSSGASDPKFLRTIERCSSAIEHAVRRCPATVGDSLRLARIADESALGQFIGMFGDVARHGR